MTTLRGLLVVAAVLGLACSGPAFAHKASDSYLAITVRDATISGRWDIALRDLELAVGLDVNRDGAITWGELRRQHAAIAAYALGRLALRSDTGDCAARPVAHLVDAHTDGAYAVLRFEATCAAQPRTLDVDYSLLFDVDAQHRGLLRLEGLGETRSAVFSQETPSKRFSEAGGAHGGFADYVADGARHIAIGWDHILFLVALLLPAVLVRGPDGHWRPSASLGPTLLNVTWIVSAFTLAHSITLSLGTLEVVRVPSRLVESLIAASVVATALDNLVPFLPRRRWLVAFAFGLLHGLGFAAVLIDLQLPRSALVTSLAGFNIGVELGQLALVALLVPLAFVLRGRPAYPRYAVHAGSAAIAVVAAGWCVERAFELPFMPF